MVKDGLACAVFTRHSKRTNGTCMGESEAVATLEGGIILFLP